MPAACHQGQREFGQRCVPYCKHGYKLAGPSVKYCQSNRRWSSEAPAICVPSKLLGLLHLIIVKRLIHLSTTHNTTDQCCSKEI